MTNLAFIRIDKKWVRKREKIKIGEEWHRRIGKDDLFSPEVFLKLREIEVLCNNNAKASFPDSRCLLNLRGGLDL